MQSTLLRQLLWILPLFIWTCSAGPNANPDTLTPGPHSEQVNQFGQEHPTQEPQIVLTGLDVMEKMGFEPLLGQNVGVITNHTAVNKQGEHLVDLLNATEGIKLKAIFAPEHGFRGKSQAGDAIPGGVDPATGVPIYSLYGANREPNQEMLEGIDILIFDIQDVQLFHYRFF